MLPTALTLLFGSQQAEEEAVYRMLSLSQRSLVSDRPLPLRARIDGMVQRAPFVDVEFCRCLVTLE